MYISIKKETCFFLFKKRRKKHLYYCLMYNEFSEHIFYSGYIFKQYLWNFVEMCYLLSCTFWCTFIFTIFCLKIVKIFYLLLFSGCVNICYPLIRVIDLFIFCSFFPSSRLLLINKTLSEQFF